MTPNKFLTTALIALSAAIFSGCGEIRQAEYRRQDEIAAVERKMYADKFKALQTEEHVIDIIKDLDIGILMQIKGEVSRSRYSGMNSYMVFRGSDNLVGQTDGLYATSLANSNDPFIKIELVRSITFDATILKLVNREINKRNPILNLKDDDNKFTTYIRNKNKGLVGATVMDLFSIFGKPTSMYSGTVTYLAAPMDYSAWLRGQGLDVTFFLDENLKVTNLEITSNQFSTINASWSYGR